MQTIEKNYHKEEFGTSKLAKLVHLDRTQLYRKLMDHLNTSPSDLIRQIRMNKARSLISDSEMSFREIAFQCGYSTYNHFCTVYKNHYNESPSTTRKNKRKN